LAPQDGISLPSFVFERCAILVKCFRINGPVHGLFDSSPAEDEDEDSEEAELKTEGLTLMCDLHLVFVLIGLINDLHLVSV